MASTSGATFRYSCDCDVSRTIGLCTVNFPNFDVMNLEELRLYMKEERLEREIVQLHLKVALNRDQRHEDFQGLLQENHKFKGRIFHDLNEQIKELKTELAARPPKDPKYIENGMPCLCYISRFGFYGNEIEKLREHVGELRQEKMRLESKIGELRGALHQKDYGAPVLSEEQFERLATRLQQQQAIDQEFLTKQSKQQNEVLVRYQELHPRLTEDVNNLRKENLELRAEIIAHQTANERLQSERDDALKGEQRTTLKFKDLFQESIQLGKQYDGLARELEDQKQEATVKLDQALKAAEDARSREANTKLWMKQQFPIIVDQKLKEASSDHVEERNKFSSQLRIASGRLKAFMQEINRLRQACQCHSGDGQKSDSTNPTAPRAHSDASFTTGQQALLSQRNQQHLASHDVASPSPRSQSQTLQNASASPRRTSQKRLPKLVPSVESPNQQLFTEDQHSPAASIDLGQSMFWNPQQNSQSPHMYNQNLYGQQNMNAAMNMRGPMNIDLGNNILSKGLNTSQNNPRIQHQILNGQQMVQKAFMMPPPSRAGTPYPQGDGRSSMQANGTPHTSTGGIARMGTGGLMSQFANTPQQHPAQYVSQQQVQNPYLQSQPMGMNRADNSTTQIPSGQFDNNDLTFGSRVQDAINNPAMQQSMERNAWAAGGHVAQIFDQGGSAMSRPLPRNEAPATAGVKRRSGDAGSPRKTKMAKTQMTVLD